MEIYTNNIYDLYGLHTYLKVALNYEVVVNNIKYREKYNFDYTLIPKNMKSLRENNYVQSQGIDDEEERTMMLFFVKENFNRYMKDDLYTRKFVIRLNYNDNEGLASCLSLFQFIVRNDELNLHVFVRSQHMKNFVFDNITYILMFKLCLDLLYSIDKKIKPGKIHVHITSLHEEDLN